jgi:ribonuclease VapC
VIVDSSALVTIIREEPGFSSYLDRLLTSPKNRMSAATFLEAAIVIDRQPDPRAAAKLDEIIEQLDITIEPVTAHQARIARDAYRRFGKGRGHPARLNFGDCFAYALAKVFDEPLLFIGQDFIHTDVGRVLT